MNKSEWRTKDPWDLPKLKKLDPYMWGHKGCIAGGCFKNLFLGEPIKDLDIFFKCEKDWADAVQTFKTRVKEDKEWAEYYKNDKVHAFKNLRDNITVELCKTVYGTPDEIISAFDFTITKFVYFKLWVEDDDEEFGGHWEYSTFYHEDFFEHLTQRRLVIDDKLLFPMSTFDRMFRYAKYGYQPCRATKLRIVKELQQLSENEISLPTNFYNGMD